MSKEIVISTIQGVRDARKVEERDYRDVPDSGLAVARGGRIRVEDHYPEIDRFPYLVLPGEDGLYRIHIPAAVALAWITPEDRAAIRARFPSGISRGELDGDDVKQLVRDLNVWKWAIHHVAGTEEAELRAVDEVPLESWSGREVRRVTNAEASDYRAHLAEAYRPPSRGGNTTALHVHVFHVDGEKFSFFSRGARKWVHSGDRVSFDYVTTEEGYRNVLPGSVVVVNAKGEKVQRGLRGRKPVLRTAKARPPASRREMRD